MESSTTTPAITRTCAEFIERLRDRDKRILARGDRMSSRIMYPTDGSAVAEHALDWAIDQAKATGSEILVLHVIEDGNPCQEIIDLAKSTEVGMIVMGTHGTGGLPRALLGSVADRVIRTSPCPVLLVPATAEEVKG